MNQQSMPIVEALQQHVKTQPVSFHVPGHKNGIAVTSDWHDMFESVFPYDQTELHHLDDLHDPDGIIAQAQRLAAEAYNALYTLFLVGGSSAGNMAMILSAFERGETVLVQRDSHKSVINALRLAGIKPVFLLPDYDNSTQLSRGLSLSTVKKALNMYPEVKGIILTSPTYYGWASDLTPIIQLFRRKGAYVLVDEAHGAHFSTSSVFPVSALDQGADAVVQSAHKTLPALTMGAFLHAGKESKLSHQRLQEAASMVQSSSPSYLIMASLDAARRYFYNMKQANDWKIAESIYYVRDKIEKETGLSLITPDGMAHDVLKCIVKVPKGYSGWDLQKCLEQQHVFAELADHQHVLLILPLDAAALPEGWHKRIKIAVDNMHYQQRSSKREIEKKTPVFPSAIMEAEQFSFIHAKQTRILLHEAVGNTAGSDLIPYPPGIPLFLKGEKITSERVSYLLEWLNNGGHVQGVDYFRGNWYISILKKDEHR
ncbi:Arginine/lysine/ornithine decarboxylase [Alteribacillus persepolensis]|uniref:Arginine/lysine/ornithine decarboxylase n=1 Tax=Alteribacillus persepolensis TaxID=568899 RepID=A0A1G8HX35_9BACI|nr:aminotransferase class I/II-fold pyridoxal phosphate-dependent enzyme [Alteribacillus persepolensis]SDI11229.1 Arginine/lysine/ornithine decarboxylase [Alteribacillus persepolensis]